MYCCRKKYYRRRVLLLVQDTYCSQYDISEYLVHTWYQASIRFIAILVFLLVLILVLIIIVLIRGHVIIHP